MNKFIMTIVMVAIFLFMVPSNGLASRIIELQPQQADCLLMAYTYGNEIMLYGDTWGQTAASITYQESWCNHTAMQTNGVVVGDLNKKGQPKSLGVMQVQLKTARYVNEKFPYLFKEKYGDRIPTDEELTIDLLIDVRFNIKVGVHYFAYLLEYKNGDWDKAILAYNRGPGKNVTDINDYVRKVKVWRKTRVIPYIKGNWKIKEKHDK